MGGKDRSATVARVLTTLPSSSRAYPEPSASVAMKACIKPGVRAFLA